VTEAVTWDPDPSARQWHRHKETSDRGWLVRREGKPAIRYDRGAHDQYVFNVGEWEPLAEGLPVLNAAHIAQVCFEADKKLCWALGHIDLAGRQWADLHEKTRAKWITDGPLSKSPAYAQRKKLYDAIQECLR